MNMYDSESDQPFLDEPLQGPLQESLEEAVVDDAVPLVQDRIFFGRNAFVILAVICLVLLWHFRGFNVRLWVELHRGMTLPEMFLDLYYSVRDVTVAFLQMALEILRRGSLWLSSTFNNHPHNKSSRKKGRGSVWANWRRRFQRGPSVMPDLEYDGSVDMEEVELNDDRVEDPIERDSVLEVTIGDSIVTSSSALRRRKKGITNQGTSRDGSWGTTTITSGPQSPPRAGRTSQSVGEQALSTMTTVTKTIQSPTKARNASSNAVQKPRFAVQDDLEPAFLNPAAYPEGWMVYHPVLGVVSKTVADNYNASQQAGRGASDNNNSVSQQSKSVNTATTTSPAHGTTKSCPSKHNSNSDQDDNSGSQQTSNGSSIPMMRSIAASG